MMNGVRGSNLIYCEDTTGQVETILARVQAVSSRNSIATQTIHSLFESLDKKEILPLDMFFTAMDSVPKNKRPKLMKRIKHDVFKNREVLKQAVQHTVRKTIERVTFQVILKKNVNVCRTTDGPVKVLDVMYTQRSAKLADMICSDFYCVPVVKGRSIHFSNHITIASHGAREKRRNVQLWINDVTKCMNAFCVIK